MTSRLNHGDLPPILELMHDAVLVLDPDDERVLAVNGRACEIYGFSREAFLGVSMSSLSKESVAPQGNINETLLTKTFHEFETEQYRADGTTLLMDVRAAPIEYDGRRAILSINRDVTERAALLRGIETSRDEWQQTVDVMDEAILLLDSDQRVLRANRLAVELAGERRGAIEGSFLTALSHAQPWRKASELAGGVIQSGNSTHGQITDLDGRTWDLSAAMVLRAGERGNIVVVVRDIGGLVDLEASLRTNETMAEMGRLVGGVAHEVRNPLFSISATSDAIEARLNADDPIMKQHMANLRNEIARLNNLMQDLLDYGRPPSLKIHIGTLSDVAPLAVRRVQKQATERGVGIIDEIPADCGRALMDTERLSAAFENLLKNAIAHSPSGTSVRLLGGSSEGEHGRRIWCRIEDSGNGFHPDDLPHVFEPFYSRRPGGTGLGLPIVKRIIDFHGGRIIAENRPEGGAAMTIVLPAYGPEAADGP
ncbi:MAG: ATP-binding protein [Acidobacteriota bacterium]